ncbi:MAG TPA: HU family DNA-binding protein [Rhizomicrobium sp.]|nr:HU family DNA-binding protein [Rhizomicrobium sp.]
MKLNEMTDRIAQACEQRPKAVPAVQKETFRLMGEALEKGEKVVIPGFGIFAVREIPQPDGTTKKAVKFRRKSDEAAPKAGAEEASPLEAEKKKNARRAKRAKAKAAAGPDEDDAA